MKSVRELQNEIMRLGRIINAPDSKLRIGEGVDIIVNVEIHGDEYHYVVVERGAEQERIVTKSYFDILYMFIEGASFALASQYAAKNRVPGENFRRLLFQRQLELHRMLGIEWEKRLQKKIDEILEKSPYKDEQ